VEYGFDVVDVHHHVGDAFAALGGATDGPAMTREAYEAFELEERLRIMGEGGVKRAIVIPGHGYLRPAGHADTRAQNDRIAACELSLGELDRAKSELGLVGMSFHTRFQGVSLDSQWISRYVARMAELGLVPVIHAMDETPEEALWKVAVLARSCPEQPMLVLDAFGSYEATRQCFFTAEVAENLIFDTSLSYNFDFIEDFARRFGAERVVFGTDLYSHPVGRRISHLLPQIVASSLTEDEKQRILAGNAERLFGL
jgi:hypothetical protein